MYILHVVLGRGLANTLSYITLVSNVWIREGGGGLLRATMRGDLSLQKINKKIKKGLTCWKFCHLCSEKSVSID